MHEDDERMEKEEEYEDESELDVGEAADLSPQNHILVRFIQGVLKGRENELTQHGSIKYIIRLITSVHETSERN